MTDCNQEVFEFQAHFNRKVTANFSGGHLSSDGGLLFIREMEMKRGTLTRLAGCFTDLRMQVFVDHSVEELLRQRIGALALGYEDLNDHDRLRHDPLCALMAGKTDVLGGDRMCEADTRGDLRRESGGEVSRGRSSEDARRKAGEAKGRRTQEAKEPQKDQGVIRNGQEQSKTQLLTSAKAQDGWMPLTSNRGWQGRPVVEEDKASEGSTAGCGKPHVRWCGSPGGLEHFK